MDFYGVESTEEVELALRHRKVESKPTTLHHKTCPICDSKRVNLYYENQSDKYICKKCMDELLGEKGGAE